MTKSGIYIITHLSSGLCYVGSAVNIQKRWDGHRHALRKGTHHSSRLQRAWKKHGPEAFQFDVLLYCQPEDLIAWEQGCLDNIICKFNTDRVAGSRLGSKASLETRLKLSLSHLGKTLSDEQKRKIAEGNRGKTVTEEFRKKMSLLTKGRKYGPQSPERRKQISEINRGRHISPETAQRISQAKLGHSVDDSTRAKISAANKSFYEKMKQEGYRRKGNIWVKEVAV